MSYLVQISCTRGQYPGGGVMTQPPAVIGSRHSPPTVSGPSARITASIASAARTPYASPDSSPQPCSWARYCMQWGTRTKPGASGPYYITRSS